MSVTEGVTKVSTAAVSAMSSQPLAIALLIVNCAFLGFAGWVLSTIGSNAAARDRTSMELITRLVADCRQGKTDGSRSILRLPEISPYAVPISNKP